MKIKEYSESGYSTKDIEDESTEWSEKGLNPGTSFSDNIQFSGDKILITPVLMGITPSGETKTYVCEDRHGIELTI